MGIICFSSPPLQHFIYTILNVHSLGKLFLDQNLPLVFYVNREQLFCMTWNIMCYYTCSINFPNILTSKEATMELRHMDSIWPIILLRPLICWVSLISLSLSFFRFSLSSLSSNWRCSCSSSFKNWCIFAYSDTTTCLQFFVSSCHDTHTTIQWG